MPLSSLFIEGACPETRAAFADAAALEGCLKRLLHSADLYLACAYGLGDPVAVDALEGQYVSAAHGAGAAADCRFRD